MAGRGQRHPHPEPCERRPWPHSSFPETTRTGTSWTFNGFARSVSERRPEGVEGAETDEMKRDLTCVDDADMVAHLVQDRETISQLQAEEIPPDEYYEELEPVLRKKFPGTDPE